MKKIAFYTAIFGDKDILKPPIDFEVNSSINYYLFTDNPDLNVYPYQTIYYPNKHKDITKTAREVKINSINLEYFKDYDVIVWHDANMQLIYPTFNNLINKSNSHTLSIFKHHRSCVYAEGIACIKANKDGSLKIFKQLLKYFVKGMPLNYGLWAGGILIINIKKEESSIVLRKWWQEVKKWSRRDQLALPFILFNNNFNVNTIDENIYENSYINYSKHLFKEYIRDGKLQQKESELKKKFFIILIKILRKIVYFKGNVTNIFVNK